jgi:hypothetical protein
MDTIFNSWWFKTAAYALLAAFGGVLGYVMRTVDKKERVIWWRAILEGLGAAFVGLLVMFVCQEMKLSQGYTGVIVGVCGWLGANVTIRLLEGMVRKKLGLRAEDLQDDTPPASNAG